MKLAAQINNKQRCGEGMHDIFCAKYWEGSLNFRLRLILPRQPAPMVGMEISQLRGQCKIVQGADKFPESANSQCSNI